MPAAHGRVLLHFFIQPAALAPLLVVGLAVLVAGCGKHSVEAPQGGHNAPPSKARLKRNVELDQARQESMASYVETVGYLDAEGQTDVAAGVAGVVEEVNFREGDWVIKDETILVRIDPEKYEAMLAQAEASHERARASVLRARAAIKKCDASCRDAEQTLDLKRVLLDNIRRAGRSAKAEERQEASANVEVAAARVDVARADKEVCQAEWAAAEKDVDAARAMVAVAKHNLRRSQVRAPYTGQINQRKVTRGTYLEDKSIIATMADVSRLRLVGFIPEKAAPMARQMLLEEQRTQIAFLIGNAVAGRWTGLAAAAIDGAGETPANFKLEFELRAFPDRKFHARIFYLSTVADPSTHLFECKAEVPARTLGGHLRPGFTAKIRCPLPGRPTSVVIREESVRASERGFVTFRPKAVRNKDGGTDYVAEAVPLELGQRKPGWVEVLKGLKAGDWVVRRGAEALEDNTPLAIPERQLPLLRPGPRSQESGVRSQ
jgi:RND family efflux transporter MFP subunit